MLKYFSKKFYSTVPTLKFVSHLKKGKNMILFATENDIRNNKHYECLRKERTKLVDDIKSTKQSLFYVYDEQCMDYPCTERMLLVQSPLNDLNKLKSAVENSINTFKALKINEFDLKFSPGFPIHQRKLVINASILATYENLEKGKVPLQDFSPKERTFEKEKKEDKKEEVKEDAKIINIVDDDIINKHKNNINLWINMAKGNIYTRNLANTRGSVANPDFFQREAQNLVDKFPDKVKMTVVKGKQLVEKNMNLLYSVGKSANSEPRMIVLEYTGSTEKSISHAIVGKGVTFDTGGLNLKPTGYMETMYIDKHGASTALGVMMLVASLNLKINIVCALALAENAIDSNSYKPGDILTSLKGHTVEVGNTDAEGRLCLADVMTYVQQIHKPKKMIDIATLTGACMVALGVNTAGLFTNNEAFASKLQIASKEVLEPVWHLPINDEHRDSIKSKVADINNSGKDRYGGASQAAAFLEHFVENNTEWIHLDIAGYGTDVHPDDYNEIINDEDEEDTDKTTTSSDEASS